MHTVVNKAVIPQFTRMRNVISPTRACTVKVSPLRGPGRGSTSLLSSCFTAFCRYADSHYRGCRDSVTAIKGSSVENGPSA